MSIITSYLLADEEEKKRQREGYMDILKNSHTATLAANAKMIPSVIKAGVKDVASQIGDSGMLSGAWENIKGFGKHLAENNPISLRFQEVQAGVDAYDNYWLTRLGHEGTPLKEDYNNEDDFMIDYKKYWNERPLDYTWFNHYGD